MSLRSAINFNLLLAFRKYSGELQFKHPEKELTIKVSTLVAFTWHFYAANKTKGLTTFVYLCDFRLRQMILTLLSRVCRETRIPSRCLEEKSHFRLSASFWRSGTRWPVPSAGEFLF